MKKYLAVILLAMAALLLVIMPMAMAEAVDAVPAPAIDLTPVFQAVIGLLAALITYKVVPWIKARTTEAQQAMLESTARIAVFAAEQLYGALKGDEKLRYAQAYLQGKGYNVHTQEVKNTIEAMVQELTLGQQNKPPDA